MITGGVTDVAASSVAGLLDDNSRVFNINSASAATTLTDLTITGGRTAVDVGNSDNTQSGGGIRSLSDLTINDSTISGNSTAGENSDGGGFFSAGATTLTNSTVSDNFTTGNYSSGGGFSSTGATTLTDSIVSDNSTTGRFSNGGGFTSVGATTLTDSIVSDNSTVQVGSDGGGIAVFGVTELTNSTVNGNSTTEQFADGGGIAALNELTLTNSTVSDNSTAGSNAFGGGIFNNNDTTTLTNSTVNGNSTTGFNAAGGGIYSGGSVTLTNSTFSGNFTTGDAAESGGIHSDGAVALTNSIVLGNVSTMTAVDELFEAEGYGRDGIPEFNGLNIVGANDAAFDASGDANVINADPMDVFAITGMNSADANVIIGQLADNGGPVETIALNADINNPALDVGDAPMGITTDANGNARAVDQTLINNGGTVDAGAVELQTLILEAGSLVVTTTADVVDASDGLTSLREAITFANSNADQSDITFANGMGEAFENGGTIQLTGGELTISSNITIDGDLNNDGVADIVVSGDTDGDDAMQVDDAATTFDESLLSVAGSDTDDSRVFNVTSGTSTITGLAITGGSANGPAEIGAGGGIRISSGSAVDLTLNDTIVSGNFAGDGGGIFNSDQLTLNNSTVSDNSAFTGGGIFSDGSSVILTDTTVSDNAAVTQGGGILSGSSSSLSLENVTVSGNNGGTNGGGIANFGTAILENTTLSNNSAGNDGGGIFNEQFATSTLINTTISGNSASGNGGGIFNNSSAMPFPGEATLTNTIVLGNTATNSGDEISGTITDNGGNITSGNAADVFESIDMNGGGTLADNGGPVQTIALNSDVTNPALNVVTTVLTTDARGVTRPNDGTADIGAFELPVGTAGNDLLIGTSVNDTINGFGGDDTLIGLGANDTLDGGEGGEIIGDTADYSDAVSTVIAQLGIGSATGADIGTDTLMNIENVTGGAAGDLLVGDDQANTLTGNGGGDQLNGGAGGRCTVWR